MREQWYEPTHHFFRVGHQVQHIREDDTVESSLSQVVRLRHRDRLAHDLEVPDAHPERQ